MHAHTLYIHVHVHVGAYELVFLNVASKYKHYNNITRSVHGQVQVCLNDNTCIYLHNDYRRNAVSNKFIDP